MDEERDDGVRPGEGADEREEARNAGDTGERETGDLTGATTTHAGAGGDFGNTGGTGTAPTE